MVVANHLYCMSGSIHKRICRLKQGGSSYTTVRNEEVVFQLIINLVIPRTKRENITRERKKLILPPYISSYIALHYAHPLRTHPPLRCRSTELMQISILPINILINFLLEQISPAYFVWRALPLCMLVSLQFRTCRRETTRRDATQHFQTHVGLIRWRAVAPEMTSGD